MPHRDFGQSTKVLYNRPNCFTHQWLDADAILPDATPYPLSNFKAIPELCSVHHAAKMGSFESIGGLQNHLAYY
jgi:hypothetical protein